MHSLKLPLILISMIPCIVLAIPRPDTVAARSITVRSTDQTACGDIAALAAGKNITELTVPASLAWECLQSVPIDIDSAVAWLETLKPYISWQSTLAYLIDPPAGYPQPAFDIYAVLDTIISNTKNGRYANEYSMEYDLFQMFQNAHDDHLSYLPNLISNVLTFGRPVALVSATTSYNNGIPKQYVYTDVLLSSTDPSFKPSAITHIDGTNVVTFLEALSELESETDPGALWNALFASPASLSLASIGFTSGPGFFAGFGGGQYQYPGDNTTLTFENGTTTIYQNFARLIQNFTDIRNGNDVFNNYVNLSMLNQPDDATLPEYPTVSRLPGYPSPVIINSEGLISGYYLEGDEYQDVAVLSIPTFNAVDFFSWLNQTVNFTDAAYDFIDKAKAAGKSKLIIDLSANGGGIIPQGYSLFIKLFPDLLPWLGQRIRATESANLIGQAISREIDLLGGDPSSNDTAEQDFGLLFGSPLDYQDDLDANYRPFPSWPAKFGPHAYHGDNFSSIFRYNATEESYYDNSTATGRPFEAGNIVLVSDGACGSTCSIFTELLTSQGGVKTIAVGGPPSQGPMQALGATKGANNYPWYLVWLIVNSTRGLYPDEAAFDATVLGDYNLLPFMRGLQYGNSINYRDQIRQDDPTETPLQFVYQPADCRIWNTLAMSVDVTQTWKAAYDVAWGGQQCINGNLSAGNGSSWTNMDVGLDEDVKMPVLSEEEATLLRDSMKVWQDQRHAGVLGGAKSRLWNLV